jgi:lysozyme
MRGFFHELEKEIQLAEGYSSRPYEDTADPPVATIGYGTTMIPGVGPVTLDTPQITPEDALSWLRIDLYGALIDCEKLFVNFNQLTPVRQQVLANMAYNLGYSRLKGFKNMRAELDKPLNNIDYGMVAYHMLDSKWHKDRQVGNRSKRLSLRMRA